jgi:putative Ca2+/H+ antiporter (TMEM165/GDT1 family)
MAAFLPSLLFVTLAEMGDKTQLLAMAFATRFPARTVLSAVFVATLLNHALAVAAGRLLTNVIPLDAISLAAALSFILFGLWTLRGDTLEGEDQRRSSYGPFLTVAVAFFLAELGDKTQLATISLAVRYSDSIAVLLGTTAGMVVADSIGIGIGIVLAGDCRYLIRLVSAGVFIFFGLAAASSVLTTLPLAVSSALLFALAVATLGPPIPHRPALAVGSAAAARAGAAGLCRAAAAVPVCPPPRGRVGRQPGTRQTLGRVRPLDHLRAARRARLEAHSRGRATRPTGGAP